MSILVRPSRVVLALSLVGVCAFAFGALAADPVEADETAPVPTAGGAEVFAQNCVACHGPRGDGDGPAAASLTPKPRKLSSKEIMSKISDDTIFNTVKKGGAAFGKSPLMPPFAHLTDAQVKDLVAHIRTLCNCKYVP